MRGKGGISRVTNRAAIRRNIKLAEAPSHGIPIHLHDPNSNGGQDYQKVSSVLESRWGAMSMSEPVDTPHATVLWMIFGVFALVR